MDDDWMPEMNVHVPGTPDVPDIVRPGDWIVETDEIGDVFAIVIKVERREQGEWDSHPGAQSWTIIHLGTGYLTGEKLSSHDVSYLTQIVAVNGELLPLKKLGYNEKRTVRVCQKPEGIEVPKTVESLIRRMNAEDERIKTLALLPKQLSLFEGA